MDGKRFEQQRPEAETRFGASVQPTRDLLMRYGVALGLAGLALLLRGVLPFPEGAGIYQLPLAAVVITAWYGGRGPGWLASAISVIGAMYLLPPAGSFAVHPEHALPLSIFAALCLLLTEFGGGRRGVEQALRESEARFRKLTDLSVDGYWKQDENLRFTYAMDDRHGFEARSLGKTRWELPFTPLSASWDEHRAVLIARKPFHSFEYSRVHPDGTTRYISVSGVPVFDDQGAFKGYDGVASDITPRKLAEAERRRHVWFLESLDRIHRAIQGTSNLETMINAVLAEVRDIFQSDRAVLSVFGTRSGTAWYRAPLAIKLRPGCEHPDKVGLESVADEDSTAMRLEVRAAGRPVQLVLGSVPAHVARVHAHFGTQSVLSMAIEARHAGLEYDHFYYFTVDECSHRRVWTAEEMRLFEEIGRRLGDALTRLSTLGELQRRDAYLSEAQRLSHTASWAWNAARNAFVHWSRGRLPLLGPDSGEFPTFEKVRQSIHPEDRDTWSERFERAMRERSQFELEYRSELPDGRVKHFRTVAHPVLDGSGELLEFVGTVVDITAEKHAEAEHRAHVWFLESMDRINRAMQGTSDLEHMMRDVLEAVLDVFACDRAWLVHPCDPDAPSWRVVMEHTQPQFPGAFAEGRDMPMSADSAEVARAALASSGALPAGPGHERAVKPQIADRFAVHSEMLMALRPKGDQPYLFGLHQCSQPRTWTKQEQRLFEEIGHRLADALSSLVAVRSVRESERRLEAAQRLAHVGWWERDYATGRVSLSDEASRIFGVEPVDLPHWDGRWRSLIHPEDRDKAAAASEMALAGAARYDAEYRVVRPDGAVRVVHSQGDVTRDESGRPVRQFGVMQDITGLRQAEDELRASEARLEEAQRIAHLGYWDRDLVANRVVLAEESWRIFGVPPQERTTDLAQWRERWLSLIHPEDRSRVLAAVTAALAGGPRYDVEFRITRADGEMRVVRSQGDVTRDASGRPWRMFGTQQDITELRQAEQLLRARQEMLDLAQTAARAVAFDWYIGARESENRWSPELEAMYGLEPGTFEHTYPGWKKLVHPDDWPTVKLALERANQSGEVDAEYRVVQKDDSVRWLQAKGRMFFDADRRPERMVGFMIDVTGRRQAEEDLRAAETRFRTFVDHAIDAFFLHDEQLRLVDVNRQACQSLGYTREELVGMHPRDFDVTLDEAAIARLAQRARAGEKITFETRHRRKDGTEFPVEIRTAKFRQGEKVFHLALARDTSERKLVEATLRDKDHALQSARDELARVSRVTMMGELTAAIAHEVNQPLGAMVANAAACTRWLAADPPETVRTRRALESIAADGRRASEIIGRIRELVKRQSPRKELVDVNVKVMEVIELAADEIRRNHIALRTELADGLPRVKGDPVQLQQVLLNLILNAIDAMSPIRDRARKLTIASRPDGADTVLVEVRDTGPGLDPEGAAQVFEPFYTTKSDGLGIGLSISRSIVEAHGGQLSVNPNQPHGASFRFSLPVGGAAP